MTQEAFQEKTTPFDAINEIITNRVNKDGMFLRPKDIEAVLETIKEITEGESKEITTLLNNDSIILRNSLTKPHELEDQSIQEDLKTIIQSVCTELVKIA